MIKMCSAHVMTCDMSAGSAREGKAGWETRIGESVFFAFSTSSQYSHFQPRQPFFDDVTTNGEDGAGKA
jgi:hypothetical protein